MAYLRYSLLFFIFSPLVLWAADQQAVAPFQEGKQYVLLANNTPDKATGSTEQVVEFFSYGCPWCARLEPTLEKWLKTKPANVEFSRVPVAFSPQWKVYARAYYVAEALGVEKKLTPEIFNAVHVEKKDLSSEQSMQAFFATQGVSKEDFESAYSASPTIDANVAQGETLLRKYRISGVPGFVVGGKYKTDSSMVGGDMQRLMQVVDFLVKKDSDAKATTAKSAV